MARTKPAADATAVVFPGCDGDPTLGGAIRPEMFDALQASYRSSGSLQPGDDPDPATPSS